MRSLLISCRHLRPLAFQRGLLAAAAASPNSISGEKLKLLHSSAWRYQAAVKSKYADITPSQLSYFDFVWSRVDKHGHRTALVINQTLKFSIESRRFSGKNCLGRRRHGSLAHVRGGASAIEELWSLPPEVRRRQGRRLGSVHAELRRVSSGVDGDVAGRGHRDHHKPALHAARDREADLDIKFAMGGHDAGTLADADARLGKHGPGRAWRLEGENLRGRRLENSYLL